MQCSLTVIQCKKGGQRSDKLLRNNCCPAWTESQYAPGGQVQAGACLDGQVFCTFFDISIFFLSIGRFLLKVGVFFIMVYTCFTITVGVFPSNSTEKIGHDKIFRGENGNILEKENVGQDGGAIFNEEEEVVRVVENIPGELHVIAGILNLVQVSSKDLHHR